MAHGLEVVVEAAQILKDRGRTDIAFCLVGDGAQRERLEQLVVERAVEPWVRFAGRQPSARIPGILAGSAACLVHLKDCELFETVIPSKIFEAMAMGRPIILGVRGDAREIVGRAQAGLEMEPGSAASLVSCVSRLADEPGLVSELGAKGRDFVDKYYNRDRLAREMLGVIEQAVDARLSACASGAGTGTGAGAGAPHSHRGGTLQ